MGWIRLPETNSKFAPENGWLEDDLASFWVSTYFRCVLASVESVDGLLSRKGPIWSESAPFPLNRHNGREDSKAKTMIVVVQMDSKIKNSHPEQYVFKRADLLKLVMIMEGYPRNGGIKWSTMVCRWVSKPSVIVCRWLCHLGINFVCVCDAQNGHRNLAREGDT